tara:strand:+ start:389 stop:961 length:573 start_codon:yes stop_codon:yes gene_type:complete
MSQSLQKNDEVQGLVRNGANGSIHVLNGGRRRNKNNRRTRNKNRRQRGGAQALNETNARYESHVGHESDNALFKGMRPVTKSLIGGKKRRNRRNRSSRRRRSRHQRRMNGGRRTRKNRNQRKRNRNQRNSRRNRNKNRKQQGGSYRQYMSNIAMTPSYSVGGVVGKNDSALANPPPITRTDNCVNEYKHV